MLYFAAPDTVKLTTEGDLTYFDNLQDDVSIQILSCKLQFLFILLDVLLVHTALKIHKARQSLLSCHVIFCFQQRSICPCSF